MENNFKRLNLITERLEIRNLKLSDLTDFHAYRSNPEVTKYQGFDVFTFDEANSFIEEHSMKEFGTPGEWVQYGIENRTSDKLIGDCAIKLQQDDPRIAEIGITVSPAEQKNGYAKEALTGILTFLFDAKGIRRVVEIVDTENVASIRLLESLGFRQEGHFIENIYFKGKWSSEYQYAMLKHEWDEIKINLSK